MDYTVNRKAQSEVVNRALLSLNFYDFKIYIYIQRKGEEQARQLKAAKEMGTFYKAIYYYEFILIPSINSSSCL